jgi:hypothetical protein
MLRSYRNTRRAQLFAVAAALVCGLLTANAAVASPATRSHKTTATASQRGGHRLMRHAIPHKAVAKHCVKTVAQRKSLKVTVCRKQATRPRRHHQPVRTRKPTPTRSKPPTTATSGPTTGAPTTTPTVGGGTSGTPSPPTPGGGVPSLPPVLGVTPPALQNVWFGVQRPQLDKQTATSAVYAGGAVTGGQLTTTATRAPTTHITLHVVATVSLSQASTVTLYADACYHPFTACATGDASARKTLSLPAGQSQLNWDVALDTASPLTSAWVSVFDINAGSANSETSFSFSPCFQALTGVVCEADSAEETAGPVSMTRTVPPTATSDGYGDAVDEYLSGGYITATATRTSANTAAVHIVGEYDATGTAGVTAQLVLNGCNVEASAWCTQDHVVVAALTFEPGRDAFSADATVSAPAGQTLYSVSAAVLGCGLATPPSDGSSDPGCSSPESYLAFAPAPGQAG